MFTAVGGNRTESGAEAQGVVSSVLQTCKQQAKAGHFSPIPTGF